MEMQLNSEINCIEMRKKIMKRSQLGEIIVTVDCVINNISPKYV